MEQQAQLRDGMYHFVLEPCGVSYLSWFTITSVENISVCMCYTGQVNLISLVNSSNLQSYVRNWNQVLKFYPLCYGCSEPSTLNIMLWFLKDIILKNLRSRTCLLLHSRPNQ